MAGGSPRSIRGQIAALLWLAVLPLTILHIRATYETYELTLAHAATETFGLAEAVAASTEQLLSVAKGQVEAIAREHGNALLDSSRCMEVVGALHPVLSYIDELGVQDVTGGGVCVSFLDEPDTARFDDREWFQSALVADGAVVSGPILGARVQRWVVPVSVAIRNAGGEALGTVMGTLPLIRLQELLGGVEIASDELVSLVTADRVVVARSDEPERYVGTVYPAGVESREEIAPGRWTNRIDDFHGVDRTWAVVRLRTVDWDAIVGVPTERVRAPALAATARDWGVSAAFVALALLLLFSMHRRTVGSLHDLVDGVRLAAVGHSVPLPKDSPEEVATVVSTVNETLAQRDRAEEAEREAKLRFRSILDNAVFGIFMSTPDGRFLDVNPAMATMLGYDSPDELKAAGSVALYASPGDREQLVGDEDPGLGTIEDLEVEWVRKDGTPITVRLNGKVLREGYSEPVFEMIVEDITEAKFAEQQLRQTQKMEAVGRLAGGIAHDFNNLLTVISLNSELLLTELGDGEARAEVTEIAEATARAQALTGQLLAFSRSDEVEPEALDPAEVVLGLQRMLSRLLDESIRVETVLEPDTPPVYADRGQLEQIIVNLVVNARDAMPEGGRIGILTYGAEAGPPGWVSEGGGAPRPTVCIAVEDDGIGMDELTRSRIFEPFFTTKPEGRGSGLGLATAYGIATNMGGHLTVTSELGEGSRFELWLPAVGAESGDRSALAGTAAGAVSSIASRGTGETILVAEDEAQIRRVIERMLEHAGYEVVLARDGGEAIEVVRDRSDLDLVLTDVMMPDTHGTELAEFVARTRPGLPVLFMSGHTFEHRLGDCHDPGAFLAKPFTAAELIGKVGALLAETRPDERGRGAPE